MSEQYKDIAELIEYHIKQDTNKLIQDFIDEIDILLSNRYINSHAIQWAEYNKEKWMAKKQE